jgi:glycosyltransferase involved in cell wall biosynthesis
MRILHINKYLYRRGGAESYMQETAALQRRAGFELQLFGMAHEANPELALRGHFPRQVDLEPPPDRLVDRVRSVSRMFWNIEAARGMGRVVEAFEPDVAHLHNVYHHLSPSILRPLRRAGVPAVMTLHDYKLACPTYRFLDGDQVCEACIGRRFHNAPIRACKEGSRAASALLAAELAVHTFTGAYGSIDAFICPSRFMLDKMNEAGVYPDRLVHVPHFVDLRGRPEPGPPPVDGPVVFAGRLSREKGVDVLIRAVAATREAPKLVIAGEGPERGELERLAAGTVADIEFVGRLDGAGMGELLRSARVVVLPSRWYENQPMIVLEGLGAGRAVIGTALGGTPELIEDGTDGRVVPSDDPVALAAAIDDLVSDHERLVRMGRSGRDKVVEHFAPERHLAALEDVYRTAGVEVAVA